MQGDLLFNLSFLEQIQDEDFLVEAIQMYLCDTIVTLQEMQQLCDAGDCSTLGKLAHKVKSSTGLLQANHLLATLQQIELLAIEGRSQEELNPLVQTGMQQFEILQIALNTHLQKLAILS